MAIIDILGPVKPRQGFNTGDETPENGWNPKRIIAAINAMFTELYASAAGVANAVTAAAAGVKLEAVSYTVLAADDTANTVDIDTGLASIDAAVVQILRAGAVATSDALVSWTGGVVTVANGATYVLTADDVVNIIAIGA